MESRNGTFMIGYETNNVTVPPAVQITPVSSNVHQMEVFCNKTSHESLVGSEEEKGQVDALLYIVVVLLFYAFAMVVLMIKYIRRENQEAELSFYFTEFVKREQFQDSRFQNQQSVEAMKTVVAELYEPVSTPEYRITAV